MGKSQLVSERVTGKGHVRMENSQPVRRRAPYVQTAVTPALGTETKRGARAIKPHSLQNSSTGITSCQSWLVFRFISMNLAEGRAGRCCKSSGRRLFVECQPKKKKSCRRGSKAGNGLVFSRHSLKTVSGLKVMRGGCRPE